MYIYIKFPFAFTAFYIYCKFAHKSSYRIHIDYSQNARKIYNTYIFNYFSKNYIN